MLGPGWPLWQGSEAKIDPFKANVRGAVEAYFEHDLIMGSNAKSLFRENLKEPVFQTQGEIVTDNPLSTDREDFIEPMNAQ